MSTALKPSPKELLGAQELIMSIAATRKEHGIRYTRKQGWEHMKPLLSCYTGFVKDEEGNGSNERLSYQSVRFALAVLWKSIITNSVPVLSAQAVWNMAAMLEAEFEEDHREDLPPLTSKPKAAKKKAPAKKKVAKKATPPKQAEIKLSPATADALKKLGGEK